MKKTQSGWRANRASHSNIKIAQAMKAMQARFSFTEFKQWNGKEFVTEFKIGAGFPAALEKLGAIDTKFGEVKLNPRITALRPSTVRKRINEYVTEKKNEAATKAPKQIKFKQVPVAKTENTFDEIVIALKAKLKQEVMAELLASLK